ncbi:MAG: bifunctional precorrin-2 dehydrogenase/sirohydrochlorin ferrochelatase [Aggregatilineales bacterium]
MTYLISLHLQNRTCLVVGGGKIATRKIRDLLTEGANVTVISPQISPQIPLSQITHIADGYQSEYLHQIAPFLVFAATNQPDVNRQIVSDAQNYGVLVNSVDGHNIGDFDNVMQIEKSPLTIGISTGGASPALGVHLRDEIADVIGEAYPLLATWLGELRPQLKHAVEDHHTRHAFWHSVLQSDVLPLLKVGKQKEAHAHLQAQFKQVVDDANAIAEATQS